MAQPRSGGGRAKVDEAGRLEAVRHFFAVRRKGEVAAELLDRRQSRIAVARDLLEVPAARRVQRAAIDRPREVRQARRRADLAAVVAERIIDIDVFAVGVGDRLAVARDRALSGDAAERDLALAIAHQRRRRLALRRRCRDRRWRRRRRMALHAQRRQRARRDHDDRGRDDERALACRRPRRQRRRHAGRGELLHLRAQLAEVGRVGRERRAQLIDVRRRARRRRGFVARQQRHRLCRRDLLQDLEQTIAQLGHRRALARILRQRARHQRVDRRRQPIERRRPLLRRQRRRLGQERDQPFARPRRRERQLARQHLEQRAAEREDVGAPVDGRSRRGLGRHVAGRADDRRLERLRHLELAGGARHTEVEHLDVRVVAATDEHDVRRLQIAVHDVARMRDGDGLGDAPSDLERGDDRQRGRRLEHRRQRLAIDELHDDVGRVVVEATEIERARDAIAADRGSDDRFLHEALFDGRGVRAAGRLQHLERGEGVGQPHVREQVDAAHAAGAEQTRDAIVAHRAPDDRLVRRRCRHAPSLLFGEHCVEEARGRQ